MNQYTYYKTVYEKELLKINKRLKSIFKNKSPKSLYEPSDYIAKSGGKKLRPFLVLVSAKAVGAKFSDAYNAAIAVELLHNFTLVHDDIMDNAEKRRGRATVHSKYDLSTAILTGDNLIAYSYKMLVKDCKTDCRPVVNTFTKGIIEVCEGQSLDELYESETFVSLKDYKKMIYKKTAALAGMSCSVGAQIGGGSPEEVKALFNYGKYLGMAFQIKDDLLDVFADESKFGKIVGGDLLEGKKTYLLLKAIRKAEGEDHKKLLNVIKNKGIKKTQINYYKNLYVKLNVAKDAQVEIRNYTGKALKSLNIIKNEEAKNILVWLAKSMGERNS